MDTFLIFCSLTQIMRNPILTKNEIIERKNLVEQIRFTRFLAELLFNEADLTPSAGSPIVLIIDAYVRIAIPIAMIPIFSGPNFLARYVKARKPIKRVPTSALLIDNILITRGFIFMLN